MNAQIVQSIFAYCGIQPVGLELLHPADKAGADEGLQQAADIGRRLVSAG